MDDPLDFIDFADVLVHGDPGKWEYAGAKPGSPTPAKSTDATHGTMKHYDLYKDEFKEQIEVHYFRNADGSVDDVKVVDQPGKQAMLTKEAIDLIRQVRAGRWDRPDASALEGVSAGEFVADLSSRYLICFQERRIGNKHEVGLARSTSLELVRRQIPHSSFSTFFFMPVLRRCIFVSSYHHRVTDITTAATIQVVPKGGDSLDVTLNMGLAHKLDKTPDGWHLKRLKKRPVTLTESFLSARGWNFGVFDVKSIE